MHHRVQPKGYQPESDCCFQITIEHVYEPQKKYNSNPKARRFPELRHTYESLDIVSAVVNVASINLMIFRIGQGFDFHPLVERRRLILAGIEIPYSHGLQGHSDADVAAHD